MKPGDVVSVIGTLRVSFGDRNWVEYKVEKGSALLMLYVGTEGPPTSTSHDDAIRLLNRLSLVHTDQLLPTEIDRIRKAIAEKRAATKAEAADDLKADDPPKDKANTKVKGSKR